MVKIGYQSKEKIMQSNGISEIFYFDIYKSYEFALFHHIDCAQILVYHVL